MSDQIPFQLVYCIECLLPVDLEEAKTNDYGKPVHESCYVYRLREAQERNLQLDEHS